MNMDGHITTPIEFHHRLSPGDTVWRDGEQTRVVEVARLKSTLLIAGEQRPLWVVLHGRLMSRDPRPMFFAIILDDQQEEWVFP